MAWTNPNPHRGTREYQRWRRAVLRRDNYTCQGCGHQGTRNDGYMEADHIHNLAEGGSPTDLTNGQTLCRPCHQQKTQGESRRGRLRRSNRRGTLPHPALTT